MDQDAPMMASRSRPICVDLRQKENSRWKNRTDVIGTSALLYQASG